MKHIISVAFLLVSFIAKAQFNDMSASLFLDDDCDACGCSANGGSLGFSSLVQQNFVGVRYFYQHYTSKDGLYNDSPWIDEHFNTLQIWSKIPITKRIELSAIVPFQFHESMKTDGSRKIEGLGDVTLTGIYKLWNTEKEEGLNHTIDLGAGVKFPTGKFNKVQNGSVNPSFQVGTGSWDYLMLGEYAVEMNRWGWQNSFSYVLKTENDSNYKFGNQLNFGSFFFHRLNWSDWNVVPQLGVNGETYASNKQFGETLKDTKGHILFAKIGSEFGYQKWNFGATAMLPLNQNLTGGNVKADYRWSIHLNYSL